MIWVRRTRNNHGHTVSRRTNRHTFYGLSQFFSLVDMWIVYFSLVICGLATTVCSWQSDLDYNLRIDVDDLQNEVDVFSGNQSSGDYFKVTMVDGESILVGARNYVYNLSLSNLKENKRVIWPTKPTDITMCQSKLGLKPTESEDCQNYIRVLVKSAFNEILVCGTNAFKPWCRTYRDDPGAVYTLIKDETGEGLCPYAPTQNNTAVYVVDDDNEPGRLFAGTVSDLLGRDAVVYSRPLRLRTQQHDSLWLNKPNFVGSLEWQDHVYFFFRENAVEYINCGKKVYSRVARVCKNDRGGGKFILQNYWTTFFKSRLNCSIPGEYPFYFDELQAITQIGEGNYMPTTLEQNKTSMVYGLLTTPENSLPGAAICAFSFPDMQKTFAGAFKEQMTPHSIWLPVNEIGTPKPHPAEQCRNNSAPLDAPTLSYIKRHPIMDMAVPAFGGRPIVVQSGFGYQLSTVTVDWHVLAADSHYYDVLFIGTTDGRVIKAVNKGRNGGVDTVVIEDLVVFKNKAKVVKIELFKKFDRHNDRLIEKLVIVSEDEIKSIPMHRCHVRPSCMSCVALQDPYCSWTMNRCMRSRSITDSLQNIHTGNGTEVGCEYDPNFASNSNRVKPTSSSTKTSTPQESKPCNCPLPNTPHPHATGTGKGIVAPTLTTPTSGTNNVPAGPRTTEMDNRIPVIIPANPQSDPQIGRSVAESDLIYPAYSMGIAVAVSIVLSLSVGFAAGCLVNQYRHRHKKEKDYERNLSRKTDNRPDYEHHYTTDSYFAHGGFSEKPLNNANVDIVINSLKRDGKSPNGGAETVVQQSKGKKVYL